MNSLLPSMKLLRYGFLFVALAAVACGGDDERKKFGAGQTTGGRTGSGGRTGDGGRTGSGGRTGDGGSGETGGADGGPGGSGADGGPGGAGAGGRNTGGAGGAETGGAGGGTGGVVVEPTCNLTTGNEICDGCIHSDCSFQCAACEGDEDCASIVDCVLAECASGLTTACLRTAAPTCRGKYPGGDSLFIDVVFNCGRSACSTFCPFIQ